MTCAVKATQASAQVKATAGLLYSVVLTAGADAASATVYNNDAGSGDQLVVLKAAAGSTVTWSPAAPVSASKGLYVAVTGTTPDVFVVYV